MKNSDQDKSVNIDEQKAHQAFAKGVEILNNKKKLSPNDLKKASIDALKYFDTATSLFPNGKLFNLYKSYAYNNLERYDMQLECLNKEIKNYPEESLAYKERGKYFDFHEEDKALEDYSKAIELDQNDHYIYYARARIYDQKGKFAEALSDINKSIELSSNLRLMIERSKIHLKMNNQQQAIDDLTYVIENKNSPNAIDVDLKDVYFSRGKIFYSLGNHQKALEDLLQTKNSFLSYEREFKSNLMIANCYRSLGDKRNHTSYIDKAFDSYVIHTHFDEQKVSRQDLNKIFTKLTEAKSKTTNLPEIQNLMKSRINDFKAQKDSAETNKLLYQRGAAIALFAVALYTVKRLTGNLFWRAFQYLNDELFPRVSVIDVDRNGTLIDIEAAEYENLTEADSVFRIVNAGEGQFIDSNSELESEIHWTNLVANPAFTLPYMTDLTTSNANQRPQDSVSENSLQPRSSTLRNRGTTTNLTNSNNNLGR